MNFLIFSDEKINHEKNITERLKKNPKIENTNQKIFILNLTKLVIYFLSLNFSNSL